MSQSGANPTGWLARLYVSQGWKAVWLLWDARQRKRTVARTVMVDDSALIHRVGASRGCIRASVSVCEPLDNKVEQGTQQPNSFQVSMIADERVSSGWASPMSM
jgi:hypothetical protein